MARGQGTFYALALLDSRVAVGAIAARTASLLVCSRLTIASRAAAAATTIGVMDAVRVPACARTLALYI